MPGQPRRPLALAGGQQVPADDAALQHDDGEQREDPADHRHRQHADAGNRPQVKSASAAGGFRVASPPRLKAKDWNTKLHASVAMIGGRRSAVIGEIVEHARHRAHRDGEEETGEHHRVRAGHDAHGRIGGAGVQHRGHGQVDIAGARGDDQHLPGADHHR